ncbi:unnamed protein product [Bursaphelenchus okinawaensis]|uniref:C2H2-type domain-containing protein n=1 Tax=Bursaphelenchus okinawaensis TaxID=465554 RepID=A0A811KUK9_9BILA|nr:unnamed protein product [Bursaphelenchus okinawaensis]CAG9111355.1 unnamed protein product [Bursaphelenchus okinawaensis]
MAEEPQVKKRNLWNPALDDDCSKSDDKPKVDNAALNFQNCLQMLALLQKQQNSPPPIPPFLQLLTQPNASFCLFNNLLQPPKPKKPEEPAPQPSTSTVPSAPVRNPIVETVMGATKGPVNYNCCAICGQSFRLTTDLVQHVRTNHRNNRFKRKYQAD